MKNIFKNKKLLRGLLQQGDLLNTVNGGVSMTAVEVHKSEDQYEIFVKTPGLDPSSYTIFLDQFKLNVTSLYGPEDEKNGESWPMKATLFSKTFQLPAEADLDNIEAVNNHGELIISVPLKTRVSENTLRVIPIKNIN